jgi:CRISPR system Cascade subunit CasD
MRQYLVFRLYGPMSSWGDVAVGEFRPTYAYPSKSAVIGLIAAALGIRRDEAERQEALASSLGFAVRVDSSGQLLRDYHTVQAPPTKKGVQYHTRRDEVLSDDLNTMITSRDYRSDARYAIGIWVRDTETSPAELSAMASALTNPKFHLYLGRKSCPLALPLMPQVISADSIPNALNVVRFDEMDVLKSFTVGREYYWEGDDLQLKPLQVHTRRDQVLSRTRWQFSPRPENYASVTVKE